MQNFRFTVSSRRNKVFVSEVKGDGCFTTIMIETTAKSSPRGSSLTYRSSVYPLKPVGSTSVLRVSGDDLTNYDRIVIDFSSLFFVGGIFWVPAIYYWLIKRFRRIPPEQKRRRAIYAALMFSITALYAVGPHRNSKFGKWVKVKDWSLWKSWMRFFAFEVVADEYNSVKELVNEQAILGISPHGIFPFGLAFAALSDQATHAFGSFRAVVASATQVRSCGTWQ